jgi:hypothetical protein
MDYFLFDLAYADGTNTIELKLQVEYCKIQVRKQV